MDKRLKIFGNDENSQIAINIGKRINLSENSYKTHVNIYKVNLNLNNVSKNSTEADLFYTLTIFLTEFNKNSFNHDYINFNALLISKKQDHISFNIFNSLYSSFSIILPHIFIKFFDCFFCFEENYFFNIFLKFCAYFNGFLNCFFCFEENCFFNIFLKICAHFNGFFGCFFCFEENYFFKNYFYYCNSFKKFSLISLIYKNIIYDLFNEKKSIIFLFFLIFIKYLNLILTNIHLLFINPVTGGVRNLISINN